MADLDRLRRDHPGWSVGTAWVAGSTHDVRVLLAWRPGVVLSALDEAEMRDKLKREEESK